MKIAKRLVQVFLLLILALTLTACGNQSLEQDAKRTRIAATIYAQQVTQSSTATTVPSPSSTASPIPTNTSTPTPPWPVFSGTTLPPAAAIIDAENTAGLTELARWGKGSASHVSFSPQGDLLAVSSSMGVYLYDSSNLQVKRFIATSCQAFDAKFSPDGQILAAGLADGTIRLWSMEDPSAPTIFESPFEPYYRVQSVAFSPDGHLLAAGYDWGSIQVWDVESGVSLWSVHEDDRTIFSLDFSPDGQTLASGSSSGMVSLWRASDGEKRQSMGHADAVTRVVFSTDGQTLATCGGDARLWQVSNGSFLAGYEQCYQDLALSPSGETLAIGTTDWLSKTIIIFVDPNTNEVKASIELRGNSLVSAAFSPDGNTLATLTNDVSSWSQQELALWNMDDASKMAWTAFGTAVSSMAFSPDGSLLATGFAEGSVWVWQVEDGEIVHGFAPSFDDPDCGQNQASLGPSRLSEVAFSPDGFSVNGVLDDGCVRTWWIPDGSHYHTLYGGIDLTNASLSPDTLTLAAGYHDVGLGGIQPGSVEGIALWDVEQGGDPFRTFTKERSARLIAYSPDGERLASYQGAGGVFLGADYNIWIYRVSDGGQLHKLEQEESLASLRFSPYGDLLASGTTQGAVQLWDLDDGSLLYTFQSPIVSESDDSIPRVSPPPTMARLWDIPSEGMVALTFSPGGELLAVGSSTGHLFLLTTDDGMLLTTIEHFMDEFSQFDVYLGGDLEPVRSLAFSPDGRLLAVGGDDGSIILLGRP
jgi:WD40 repeat protein